MKQCLLIIGLLLGLSSQAQLTTANQLSIGDTRDYFSLDSNATNYAAVTGTAVTWDYADIAGYFGMPANTNNIIDPATGSFAADFPSTTLQEEFDNGVQTFFNNVGSDVIVDGFVYSEAGNDFIVAYDIDALLALQLPMNVTDTYTDPIDGTATIPLAGAVAMTGSATVTCDGSGTLIIGAYTYSNCIRIHTVENTSGTALGQTIDITRESFVYYDLDDANPMPIFRHDRVTADLDAGGIYGFSAISSKDAVTNYVSFEADEVNELSVYPNPATDVLNISFDGEVTQLTIMNASGQVVYTNNAIQKPETINISDFEAGVYLVQIVAAEGITTRKVTVK
jgi:hypothetical protein